MPEFYWRSPVWIKECSCCGREYTAPDGSWNTAFTIFRQNFSPRKNSRDGLESGCYRCRAIADMRIKFGIDVEAYLAAQDNKCALCKSEIKFNTGDNTKSACVDHNHKTKAVRAILCRACNLGLGHFKDDVELLRRAIEYLSKEQ